MNRGLFLLVFFLWLSACKSGSTSFFTPKHAAAIPYSRTSVLNEVFSMENVFILEKYPLRIDGRDITYSILMKKYMNRNVEKIFKKTVRQPIIQKISISNDLAEKTQKFKQDQVPPSLLDIYMVIDNSESMKEEQKGLLENLPSLLSQIKEEDWQIIIATTDAYVDQRNCHVGGKVISQRMEDYEKVYKKTIDVGIDGGGFEKTIKSALMCLKKRPQWLRKGSALAIMVISDERERSNEDLNGLESGDIENRKDFVRFLESDLSRQRGKGWEIFGLLRTDKLEGHLQDSNGLIKDQYYGNIDDIKSYDDILRKFSGQIFELKIIAYELSSFAESIVEVKIIAPDKSEKTLSTEEYSLDKNGQKVILKKLPAVHSTISIVYLPKKIFQTIPLDEEPDLETMEILINGENYDIKNISYENLKLTFPPKVLKTGVQIKLSYKTKIIEEGYFISKTVVEDSMKVTVSDKEIANDMIRYEKTSGKIFIPAKEGEKIHVTFDEIVGKKQLRYLLPAKKGEAKISIIDEESGQSISFKEKEEAVTIDEAGYEGGHNMKIIYRYPETAEQIQHDLPEGVDPKQVKIIGKDTLCVLSEKTPVHIDCPIKSDGYDNVLQYTRINKKALSFSVKLPENFNPDKGRWVVKKNKKVIKKFQRKALRIDIAPSLAEEGAKITVEYFPPAK